jgi:hypothetical protein
LWGRGPPESRLNIALTDSIDFRNETAYTLTGFTEVTFGSVVASGGNTLVELVGMGYTFANATGTSGILHLLG